MQDGGIIDKEEGQAAPGKKAGVGFDDFLEDIFGLNVKALSSVGVLFANPKRYFEAAQHPEWEHGRYTPSIRLWISAIAVLFAFQFFWGGEDSAIMESFRAQMALPQMAELLGDVTPEEAASAMSKYYFGSYPVISLALLLGVGAVLDLWGRPTTLALRERMFFATLVPATVLSLVLTPLSAVVPTEMITTYGLAIMGLDFVVNGATAWRGPLNHMSGGARLWRAITIAVIILLLEFVALFIGQFFAGIMLAATLL